MASNKPVRKESSLTSSWPSNWLDIDRSIENLRSEMEKAFSSFPSLNMGKTAQSICDVIDEGKQLRVKIDVPGVKKNEINLNVTDNSLEISAKHKEESEEKRKNYLRKERSNISYYRTLPLPEKVKAEGVKAKLADGVLDIVLPKANPTTSQKKKPIPIH